MVTIATADPDELPVAAGAYLIILRLVGTVDLPPRFKGTSLQRGNYIYAGSAYGGGGIRARCRRHLEPHGVRHWHIDWLTNAASSIHVAAFPGSNECALMNRLTHLYSIRVPVPGFGSTDCRQCPSHLIQIDERHALIDLTVAFEPDG